MRRILQKIVDVVSSKKNVQVREDDLRRLALNRVSEVFGKDCSSGPDELHFGVHLRATSVSDFSYNELDTILNDIYDAAPKKILREMKSGKRTIRTVEDYCRHMVECADVDAERVLYVLNSKVRINQRVIGEKRDI